MNLKIKYRIDKVSLEKEDESEKGVWVRMKEKMLGGGIPSSVSPEKREKKSN